MNDIYLVNKIMERSNRFEESLINSSAHRKTSAQRVKEIYIQNEANDDDTKPLRIGMNKTVKDLKREIEKLFNLNYSLDGHKLRVKINGKPASKPIDEKDEDKTLYENRFKNECIVLFGSEKNEGGSLIIFK